MLEILSNAKALYQSRAHRMWATVKLDNISVRHSEPAIKFVVQAKLAAYQGQGFWGRVFGRMPVVVPCAEPEV